MISAKPEHWRDRIDVTLPAGYTVDDLPAAVNLDMGFAAYKSDVKADAGWLHYSREYIVRQLDLAPDKSAGRQQADGDDQRG